MRNSPHALSPGLLTRTAGLTSCTSLRTTNVCSGTENGAGHGHDFIARIWIRQTSRLRREQALWDFVWDRDMWFSPECLESFCHIKGGSEMWRGTAYCA